MPNVLCLCSVEQHVSCVLEPLIRFLLLEPQQSAQFSHMRAQLPRSLLQGWGRPDLSERRAVRAQMLHLLLDLTPRLQVSVAGSTRQSLQIYMASSVFSLIWRTKERSAHHPSCVSGNVFDSVTSEIQACFQERC